MATLHLLIVTPEHQFFDDKVESIVLPGLDGELGVLAGHLPMTAALREGAMRLKLTDGTWRQVVLGGGFAEVEAEKTYIFAQTAEWPDEVDIRRAREDLELARERLRQSQSLREYSLSKAMIARAMARLRVTAHNDFNND